MELNKIHKVYFVGIGGIGMSALAKFFVAQGASVFGYDKTSTTITDELKKLGTKITFDDSETAIDNEVTNDKNTLIVYTPAIPSENKILNFFRKESYQLMKRSEVLGIISRNSYCLAVAGTHGKTTTSALLAHIMTECDTGASSFVGGVMSGYNSNLIIGDKDVMVVEADEYDRSFLKLSPNIACITSTDADHLDIYEFGDILEKTFLDFVELLPENGKLISNVEMNYKVGLSYSINKPCDYFASDIKVKEGKFHFNINTGKGEIYYNVKSNLPGKFNVENTIAAFAMADLFGLKGTDIVKSIESFKGINRRFNVFSFSSKTIVDDYAHHPTEIEVSLEAAKELFEDKKIAVIFQPHLYSRTRDFEKEFADVLAKFDEVNLLEIYPAREKSLPGITSNALLNKIDKNIKKVISKEEIKQTIESSNCDVVMMLGAGDIGVEIEKLKN